MSGEIGTSCQFVCWKWQACNTAARTLSEMDPACNNARLQPQWIFEQDKNINAHSTREQRMAVLLFVQQICFPANPPSVFNHNALSS